MDAAVTVFARGGYHGGTVAEVGVQAGISPAYVFKLFGSKTALFVEALDRCFDRIMVALDRGADQVPDQSPAEVLQEMGGAYAQLIGERALLMLQVHAQSASDIPEIAAALRHGVARVTELARSRSGGTGTQVQDFIARGQLCHLLVTTSTAGMDEQWARTLEHGIRHPSGTGARP